MNKKGFIFVETIVTLTVLIALLVVLYTTFTNLLNQEKIDAEYEKRGDRYALYYLKEMLVKDGIDNHINKFFGFENFDFLADRKDSTVAYSTYTYCNLAIVECNSNTSITHENNCVTSKDFENYIEQLKKSRNSCKEGAQYMIAGEFNNLNNTYSYAYIYYPNIKVADIE